jgi:tripartite-type tricarboxylate transporter receptor subunit TctC
MRFLGAVVAGALALLAAGAAAQSYPTHAIRAIVPFPPGGAVDLLGRIVGQKLSEAWGQPVVIDNRPGVNGALGCELAKHSPPDGYTLLVGATGTHAINPALYTKLPYDPVGDFEPVTLLGSAPAVFVVHPRVPAQSIQELIALAKTKPGELNYGAGASLFHLAMELFKRRTATDITYVPYRGSMPALSDLIAGQLQVVSDVIQTPLPFIRDGKVRALAVSGRTRSFAAPEVPTFDEAGVPGIDVVAWSGVFVPAGTPKGVVARLDAELRRSLGDPTVLEKLHQVGFERVGLGPAAFAATLRREIEQYAAIVAEAHIPKLD